MDPLTIGLVSGIAGIGGSMWQNRQNVNLSREQMRFQERMSNTEIQRRMADARTAGVNPIYALGTSGASAPTGSLTHVENPLEGGISSAIDAMRSSADLHVMEANWQKTRQEARILKAEADMAEKMARQRWDIGNLQRDQLWNVLEEIFPSDVRFRRAEAERAELALPEARLKADVLSPVGRQWRSTIGDIFSSVSALEAFLRKNRENIPALKGKVFDDEKRER